MSNSNQTSIYSFRDLIDEQQLQRTLNQELTDISRYYGDFNLFLNYCQKNHKQISGQSLLHYLHDSIKKENIKKNTFNRRYFAIKKLLEKNYGISLTLEQKEIVKKLRSLYQTHEYAHLAKITGKRSVNSEELLQYISQLKNIRDQAILLVQFYTANRPSEMIRLRIKDFDLTNRIVNVYLKKQRIYADKILPSSCIPILRQYFKEYEMTPEDYFIGAINRHGYYYSRQITERAYYSYLQSIIGLSAYNFRKSLVSHMHRKGADVQTIQKQTAHISAKTLTEHYLNVDKSTVEQYL